MPTAIAGKTRLTKNGKRSLAGLGKGQVFATDQPGFRCCCVPAVLAAFITSPTHPCEDLRGLQGPRMATPCSFWRLIEVGTCYPGLHPWYGAGCVDPSGTLKGLPNKFCTTFPYEGHMELQIGCRLPSDRIIYWPGSCDSPTPDYVCN